MFHLGGLTFDDGASGSTPFTVGADYGWSVGGVEMRRDSSYRPAAAGKFGAPGYLSERLLGWSGLVLTRSVEEQAHELRRLSGLLADGLTGVVSRDGSPDLWATVQRADSPSSQVLVPGRVASYSVSFEATDPCLYGEVRSFAAGAPVVQYGNYAASPELVVTGPHPAGYTVSAGLSSYTVTAPLAAGVTDVVDMSTGWVRRNGALLVGGVSRADTWSVPPGLPGLVHTLSGGSGSLLVRVTDTFI